MPSLQLSIVIPTYNERESIVPLLERLVQPLGDWAGHYEILVVDDASPDGTADVVATYAQQMPVVRLLQHNAPPDLSAALALGFDAARGDVVLAMDADGQHDPACLPALLAAAPSADVVVATRYAAGGSIAGWSQRRRALSWIATVISRRLLAIPCSDPLSGYFLLQRNRWQQLRPRLHCTGFKLLLEVLATDRTLQCAEAGYRFVARQHGDSKFGTHAGWHFLRGVWRLHQQQRCPHRPSP